MAILSNVSISLKDIVLLIIGGIIGWNKGKTEIRHDDIRQENPLKIYLDTTARVIGKPQIFLENDNIDFDIQKVAKNCYQIDFECINPREWIQANFYITGNPYTKVTDQGRIFGQETQFDTTTDDTIATLYERVLSLLIALFLTSTPFMLIIGLIWYFISGYSPSQLIQEQDSIPYFLGLFIYLGICGTFVFVFAFILPSIKRRQVPRNYPIEEDFKPNPLQVIKIYWITAITGKRYEVSNSQYFFGKIVSGNEVVDE